MIAAYEAGLQTGLPAADSAGPSSEISGCGSMLGACRRSPRRTQAGVRGSELSEAPPVARLEALQRPQLSDRRDV